MNFYVGRLLDYNFACCFVDVKGVLTLRKEHRLRVLKNRTMRRILGCKRDEVTGEYRRLHYEEFSELYRLPNVIRVIKSRRM